LHAYLLLRGLVGTQAAPEQRFRPSRALMVTLVRAASASIVMALALGWLLPGPGEWLDVPIRTRAWWLLMGVASGGGLYLLLLAAAGERPRGLVHRI
jgi:peptidoglycan biosynthesis protein MviN/MurJ (putative lipid II flippase)